MEVRSDPEQAALVAYASADQAYALKIKGLSRSEIAEELDIPNEDDVSRLLSERFAHEAAFLNDMQRKSLLALENARLDAVQKANWDSMEMGDPVAGRLVLEAIKTRVKINGLEQVDPVVQKNLVLVMGEKEEDYIKALKAAGAEQDD